MTPTAPPAETPASPMAHAARITVPVGAVVGGLVGLAFAPWWQWAGVGVVGGALYAALATLFGTRLMKWLRRGSPERQAGVTVGGWLGALVAAMAGAFGAVARFLPPVAGESAELFAVGALGLFAAGPVGFIAGGLVGGLLTAFFEWLDARFVSPMRAKSAAVERATTIGAGTGFAVAWVVVLIFGLNRRRARGPEVPEWLGISLLILLLLGLFWGLRFAAKRNREAAAGEVARLANPRWRAIVVMQTVGFAGGAVGFLIGVALHALGWRTKPDDVVNAVAQEKPRARPGWWRKRPRRE